MFIERKSQPRPYQRPYRVVLGEIQDGSFPGPWLFGYFKHGKSYDLIEVINLRPGPYDDLMQCRRGDIERVQEFVLKWGFLDGEDMKDGQGSPVEDFWLLRERLISLGRVFDSFEAMSKRKIKAAVNDYWNKFGDDISQGEGLGISQEYLFLELDRFNPGFQYAVTLICHELRVPEVPRPRCVNGNWDFALVPDIYRLRKSILWTFGKRLLSKRAIYRICESAVCAKEFLAERPDNRFCSLNCSARERVRKMRARGNKNTKRNRTNVWETQRR